MERARASVPPEAIRIEDEVWQEAFRERPRSRPRLRSLDGGSSSGGVIARSPERDRAPARARSPERVTTAGARPTPSTWSVPEPPARRTITITGRGAERNLPWPTDTSRRRATRKAHERAGFRPDRFAMWALFLGLLLVLVAATSAHL